MAWISKECSVQFCVRMVAGRRMVQQCDDMPGAEEHPVRVIQGDGQAGCFLWDFEQHPRLQPRYKSFRRFLAMQDSDCPGSM